MAQGNSPACPECNSSMVVKKSKFGEFWGCSNFPDCLGTIKTGL